MKVDEQPDSNSNNAKTLSKFWRITGPQYTAESHRGAPAPDTPSYMFSNVECLSVLELTLNVL